MFYLFTIEAVYTRVNMPYTKIPLDVSFFIIEANYAILSRSTLLIFAQVNF